MYTGPTAGLAARLPIGLAAGLPAGYMAGAAGVIDHIGALQAVLAALAAWFIRFLAFN